jgi:phosphoenolpyruvate synthase/pyruvate phosphate dikinase
MARGVHSSTAPRRIPDWTPLFLRASALVMETGGGLSDGANVARVDGIRALVHVRGFSNG